MATTSQRAAALLLFLFVSFASGEKSASGEVIFSRRVYKEHGASYQQIWTWSPETGALKALTNSPRNHYHPFCDGRMFRFTSPSPEVTDQVDVWNFNPASGEESIMGRVTGSEPPSSTRGCNRFAKARELEACGNEETLTVSRSGKQIGRFRIEVDTCPIDNHGTIGKCETPIRSLDWTEDGKWLLIGEEGLNDASGQRQDDYYLVNLATMKLSTVASAYTAFWLRGLDQIVYVTPQDLAPLPGGSRKHNVWVQQLMFFDPVKGRATAITSGLTNNVDPSWCESKR
ncbi:MAG TPA: hypothetical protein VGL82_03500 [Bryobacteraceae bacterium]|jgi:hypothetical protein